MPRPQPAEDRFTGRLRLIITCKRHHIDPFAYLRDVQARIGAHPQNRLEELLPDNWLAARTAVKA